MAQTINPLYGSAIKDSTITLALGLPSGVYQGMNPSLSTGVGGVGWTASLAPDSDGWSTWRTRGETTNGKFLVKESGAITVSIEAASASPRIDLIVGLHRWVEGPNDAVTLKPTGEFLTTQHATYAVIKGTPAASPSAPVVPDPYNSDGAKAVVLAQVYVPVTGAATITRWPSTDLRLDYMRLVAQEVVDARTPYTTLKQRIEAIGGNTQVQTLNFKGTSISTGAASSQQPISMSTIKRYGDAVSQRSLSTFGLTVPGLYEIMGIHSIWGVGDSESECRAYLNYNNGTVVQLDTQYDLNGYEESQILYAQVYVDEAWVNPYVYFTRGGWPAGSFKGSVKYLGTPSTLPAMSIPIDSVDVSEASNQTYPDVFTTPLQATNAVGEVGWSIVSGTGLLDGTTTPTASIVNGNQLQIVWASKPASFPQTYSVEVQATDSASSPRTVTKTITVHFYGGAAPQAISITSSDFTVEPASYPYTVTFKPVAAGGTPPYTFSVVSGADTTLTGAAFNASTGAITGTFSADGTRKVRIHVSDAASSPQVLEKVINITSTKDTVAGCVPAGTMVQTVDGEAAVENLRIGQLVLGYDDNTFESIVARIQNLYIYRDRQLAVVKTEHGELKCSRDHRLYRKESRKTRGADPHWPPVEELMPGDRTLWEARPGVLEETVVLSVDLLDETAAVYHMSLNEGHVYSAGGFPAHNLKAAINYADSGYLTS